MLSFEEACERVLPGRKRKLLKVMDFRDRWVFYFEVIYNALGGPAPGEYPDYIMKESGEIRSFFPPDYTDEDYAIAKEVELPEKFRKAEEAKSYLYGTPAENAK